MLRTAQRTVTALVGLLALAMSGCTAHNSALSAETPDIDSSYVADEPASPPPQQSPVLTPPSSPLLPFTSSISPIDDALAERMSTSWREGCPVPLKDLRYVTFTHVDVNGHARTGEIVVHEDVAAGLVDVLKRLYDARYPIQQARLVDDFGGDDDASMNANNSSAFNCRTLPGSTSWSQHAYGRAIDINPIQNPCVTGDLIEPAAGEPYLSRPDRPGVIHADDAVVEAFAASGWYWGGAWDTPVDYQHFSVNDR